MWTKLSIKIKNTYKTEDTCNKYCNQNKAGTFLVEFPRYFNVFPRLAGIKEKEFILGK